MNETLFPTPRGNMGPAHPRYEGRAKVTGDARYPSDVRLARTAHAYLHTSRIGRGTISAFDLAAAKAVPGVLDIMTHETLGDEIRQQPAIYGGGDLADSLRPLGSAERRANRASPCRATAPKPASTSSWRRNGTAASPR